MKKRLAAEFIGTFMIVFAPVALSAASKSDPGILVAALASGLPVLAMIYALGPISAAHFNPAVTFGFALAKRFPWRTVPAYWAAQLSGAILASLLVSVMFGAGHGTHIPADTSLFARNIGMETVLTFALMFVIMSVATDKRTNSATPALAIGFTVVFCVLVGGPVTGASMNPARSLGPALFAGGEALTVSWLYIVGPLLGATVGSLVFEAVRLEPEFSCDAPNLAD